MSSPVCSLTVFFEAPFWVGVFERVEDGTLRASKVIFGAEPRDQEVYAYILTHYSALDFSPAVPSAQRAAKQSAKQARRSARNALQTPGIGTKSQQALKLQQEQHKTARRETGRAEREAEAARRFALKQQKKKERHRGR